MVMLLAPVRELPPTKPGANEAPAAETAPPEPEAPAPAAKKAAKPKAAKAAKPEEPAAEEPTAAEEVEPVAAAPEQEPTST